MSHKSYHSLFSWMRYDQRSYSSYPVWSRYRLRYSVTTVPIVVDRRSSYPALSTGLLPNHCLLVFWCLSGMGVCSDHLSGTVFQPVLPGWRLAVARGGGFSQGESCKLDHNCLHDLLHLALLNTSPRTGDLMSFNQSNAHPSGCSGPIVEQGNKCWQSAPQLFMNRLCRSYSLGPCLLDRKSWNQASETTERWWLQLVSDQKVQWSLYAKLSCLKKWIENKSLTFKFSKLNSNLEFKINIELKKSKGISVLYFQ